MKPPTFRRADLTDLDDFIELLKTTFCDAYIEKTTAEKMTNYFEKAFTKALVAKEISNPDVTVLFLENETGIIGFLETRMAPSQTEYNDPDSLQIHRVYLKKAFWNQGFGQVLMDKAIELTQAAGKKYIWLGVWQENPQAIRFYEKNGFTVSGTTTFIYNDEAHLDYKMEKWL